MNLDMELDLKVCDKEWNGSLRSILKINEARLTHEFIEQAGTYAWFATLLAFAIAEVESEKMNHEVLQANLYAEKRSTMIEEGAKITEDKVKAAVLQDERYSKSAELVNETRRKQNILKAIVNALEQRKDMLIQLGSTKRQEMFSDGMKVST